MTMCCRSFLCENALNDPQCVNQHNGDVEHIAASVSATASTAPFLLHLAR